jgi:hypothetical protein
MFKWYYVCCWVPLKLTGVYSDTAEWNQRPTENINTGILLLEALRFQRKPFFMRNKRVLSHSWLATKHTFIQPSTIHCYGDPKLLNFRFFTDCSKTFLHRDISQKNLPYSISTKCRVRYGGPPPPPPPHVQTEDVVMMCCPVKVSHSSGVSMEQWWNGDEGGKIEETYLK